VNPEDVIRLIRTKSEQEDLLQTTEAVVPKKFTFTLFSGKIGAWMNIVLLLL
jgi:hypothetical protein